jgi:stage V sporulation protein SpoVS
VNASERSKKSQAETAVLLEAEVDEAVATCGGDVRAALRAILIAKAYLQTEIERLTEAISTGFARGRMRKALQRGEEGL